MDGGVTWDVMNTWPGSARDDPDLDTGALGRVRGYDSAGSPVTLYSNIVSM